MNLKAMIGQMQTGMTQGPAPVSSGVPHKAPKSMGSPVGHLKKAHAAHKSGDTKAAKGHAFNFIKALKNPEAATAQPSPTSPI